MVDGPQSTKDKKGRRQEGRGKRQGKVNSKHHKIKKYLAYRLVSL